MRVNSICPDGGGKGRSERQKVIDQPQNLEDEEFVSLLTESRRKKEQVHREPLKKKNLGLGHKMKLRPTERLNCLHGATKGWRVEGGGGKMGKCQRCETDPPLRS